MDEGEGLSLSCVHIQVQGVPQLAMCMCTIMHRVLHGLSATLGTRQERAPFETVGKTMVL